MTETRKELREAIVRISKAHAVVGVDAHAKLDDYLDALEFEDPDA